MTDSSKDFSDEILELKLQLENERQLRLQAETELAQRCPYFQWQHWICRGKKYIVPSLEDP